MGVDDSLPTDWLEWQQATDGDDRKRLLGSIQSIDELRALALAGLIRGIREARIAFSMMAERDDSVYLDLRPNDGWMFGYGNDPMTFEVFRLGRVGATNPIGGAHVAQMIGNVHAQVTAGVGVPDSAEYLDREYLLRGQRLKLRLEPSVFAPSRTTMLFVKHMQVNPGGKFYEVGFGSLILSILASKLGAASIKGSELDEHATQLADNNARLNDINDFEFFQTDLFPSDLEQQDVIVGNVPQTPAILGSGNLHIDAGEDGTYIVLRFLEAAKDRLAPGGRIYVCVASIANAPRVRAYIEANFTGARKLGEQELPIPSYVTDRLDTPHFRQLIASGEIFQKDGAWHSRDELYELAA